MVDSSDDNFQISNLLSTSGRSACGMSVELEWLSWVMAS